MFQNLQTPCLILDENILDKNFKKLKAIALNRQVIFRPHLKTAKCREITKRSAQEFGSRAMVSTLEEIKTLQNCGINDFLYSVAIVPSKFKKIEQMLNDNCNITVAVDNVLIAKSLVTFCNQKKISIPAVIELDLVGHRSGVSPTDKKTLLEIGQILYDEKLLRGVMSHAGESYALSDKNSLEKCSENEAQKTLAAAKILFDSGMNVELVTIGSTPTAISGKFVDGITELRAGVFMFFDLVQAGIGVCNLNEIALSVLTSVISYNKDIEALIVDAGWMALSRDRGTASQNLDYGYGQVCKEDGSIINDLIVTNVQQEHGIIQVRKGGSCKLPNLSPGDLLRILPNHACATAAAHDKYYVYNEKKENLKIWERFNGW